MLYNCRKRSFFKKEYMIVIFIVLFVVGYLKDSVVSQVGDDCIVFFVNKGYCILQVEGCLMSWIVMVMGR